MRIALAQINPTVGDIAHNAALMRDAIGAARDGGAELVVFPELAMIGYPPKDLLLKSAAIQRCADAVDELATHCTDIAAVIGYPALSAAKVGRPLHNAVAFCHEGRVQHQRHKSLLPTYDVFDEHRYFEPATGEDCHQPIAYRGVKLGLTVCEDLWNDEEHFPRPLYHSAPAEALCRNGAQVLINCSASPFVLDKHAFRLRLFKSVAKRHGCPVVYCNQVGGNDELVFDGNSCVVNGAGQVVAHARDFVSDLLFADVSPADDGQVASDSQVLETPPCHVGVASVYHALVLGLRDYCDKCGFKSIVIGLSGGIDSAVTAALAVAALGSDKVRGVAMPSRYSSDGSVVDAQALADRLKIPMDIVAIEPAHKAFEQMLSPIFAGLESGVAEENVQARSRGVVLMALSNKFGSLLVTTGNKSELAVGYCTLYGDMAGGLAILSDVPKTMVWDLARWINEADASPLLKQFGGPVVPENSITKPPSAELRPNQVDQDSLPPYEELDRIIELYVEQDQSVAQISQATGFDMNTVQRMVRLIDLNEYKRKQAAPGIKVTSRAFGFGRRMPIAQRYDNGG